MSTTPEEGAGAALESSGIGLVAFVTAIAASLVVFGIQMGFFLLLRNKLARILFVASPPSPLPTLPHRIQILTSRSQQAKIVSRARTRTNRSAPSIPMEPLVRAYEV
jgi:hypothetical protein